MRILFLAPQPFFQERGTPIAVRLAVEVLAARAGDSVDLLTYHEGEDVDIPGTKIQRISMPVWIKNIGPGISIKKLLCDVVFLFTALQLVRQAERKGQKYHLVHAVEESVFVAWFIRLIWKIPYIYDMDSSLAMQLTEKWIVLRPLYPILRWLERLAVRESLAVVPVCDALAAIALGHGSKHTKVLHDISLIKVDAAQDAGKLRQEMEVPEGSAVVLYIGNLERYQGVDLLIEGFASVAQRFPDSYVAVIGGRKDHIAFYQEKVKELGLSAQIKFLGPRPVSMLGNYLPQATILSSPRVKGNNTPMKIYSYLHSGVPVLATELPTHTQVLNATVAKLTAPEAVAYGQGLAELLANPAEARSIGQAARALAEKLYTFDNFQRTLNEIYDTVQGDLGK